MLLSRDRSPMSEASIEYWGKRWPFQSKVTIINSDRAISRAIDGLLTVVQQQLLPEDIGNLAHEPSTRWIFEFHHNIVTDKLLSHDDCKLT